MVVKEEGRTMNAAGAMALMAKRWIACVMGVMLAGMLALAGCAPATSGNSSASAASEMESSAAQEDQQGVSATVVVMNPDNPDEIAHTVFVALDSDATVYGALLVTGLDAQVEDTQYGKYMSSLDGKAAEGNSGWVYTVNGEEIMESIDACHLADGDTVEFKYISM